MRIYSSVRLFSQVVIAITALLSIVAFIDWIDGGYGAGQMLIYLLGIIAFMMIPLTLSQIGRDILKGQERARSGDAANFPPANPYQPTMNPETP